MSWKACDWAARCRVGNPTRKLVLLTLAENANPDGYSPVGYGYLAGVAECSKKSVQRHLAALESMGLLLRRRRRKPDGQLGGYDMWLQLHQQELLMDDMPTLEQPADDEPEVPIEDGPPVDNLTTGQNVPLGADQGTESPHQGTESPLGVVTESTPSPVYPRCLSPVRTHARAHEAPVDNSGKRSIRWRAFPLDLSEAPEGLSDAVVLSWLDERRANRRPCNQHVVSMWMRELCRAVEAGWPPDDALTMAMGWNNFFADWLGQYQDAPGGSAPAAGGGMAGTARRVTERLRGAGRRQRETSDG